MPRAPKRYTFGPEVAEWIEENCVLPSGDGIGQPFRLMEWQREYIYELYRSNASGKLQYRWSLLGVPKGNGKSPLAAALALYHLLGDPDEPDPWVCVAAASDKQADIVFDAAKRMCEMSPALNEITERYRWEIRPKGAPGKLERVAASGGKLDGKLVSMLILDELHEWTTDNWIVLTGGALKRKRSQIIQITTAGYDKDSICYREYAKGLELENTSNPTYFHRWFTAPADADYRDPGTWRAANPSYGVLVHEDVLRDLARNIPESQFRRYRLNQWVEAEEFWLPPGAWDTCSGDVSLLPREPVYIGWDASTKNDSTAIVLAQWQGDKLYILSRLWERPVLPDGSPDERWRLPIAECEQYIRDAYRTYDVMGVAYDPAYITWSAADLEAEGIPMIEWPQSPARMCPATAGLYELILEGRLVHNGDRALARHVRTVRPRNMRNGGQMLEKRAAGKKIDAAIALAMATGIALKNLGGESPAIYIPS